MQPRDGPEPNRRVQLSGRTALITGASSGIGRACAHRFSEAGAAVILTGRRLEALKEVAQGLSGAEVIVADLADPTAVDELCDQVLTNHSKLDILVLNAGVGAVGQIRDTEPDHARQIIAVNFMAPMLMIRRLLPHMPRGGSVVTVSSIVGEVAMPGLGLYSASKHALSALADILRIETRRDGIQVLNFCPGHVATGFFGSMLSGPRAVSMSKARIALTPDQCGKAILRGILRRKHTIFLPRFIWILVLLNRLLRGPLHRFMTPARTALHL